METINNSTTTNYSNTHKTSAREDFELAREMIDVTGKSPEQIKAAMEEVIKAREAVAKSNVELFTNEKGIAQNEMYDAYMKGAINQNFTTATDLNKAKINFERYCAEKEIELMKKEAETEVACQKKISEANLKLEAIKKEADEIKANKRQLWINRIFWPLLGIVLGVVAFGLLYFIK